MSYLIKLSVTFFTDLKYRLYVYSYAACVIIVQCNENLITCQLCISCTLGISQPINYRVHFCWLEKNVPKIFTTQHIIETNTQLLVCYVCVCVCVCMCVCRLIIQKAWKSETSQSGY